MPTICDAKGVGEEGSGLDTNCCHFLALSHSTNCHKKWAARYTSTRYPNSILQALVLRHSHHLPTHRVSDHGLHMGNDCQSCEACEDEDAYCCPQGREWRSQYQENNQFPIPNQDIGHDSTHYPTGVPHKPVSRAKDGHPAGVLLNLGIVF